MRWVLWCCVRCKRVSYTTEWVASQLDACNHGAQCHFNSGERPVCRSGCMLTQGGPCGLTAQRRRVPAWA